MPRRFGFGLGFNLNRLTGLPEPSGFVAKYLSYYVNDFTLVTGSNVSQWDDRSANANHLTQGTSANQPVLTEAYSNLGDEEVTNGGFDAQGDWIAQSPNATLTIANSELTVTSSGGATGAYQVISTEIGKRYRFIAYSDQTVTDGLIRVSNGSVPDAGYGDSYVSNGVAELDFVALGTSTTIYLRNTNAGTSVWQEVSVKEILAPDFNNTVDFDTDDYMEGLPTQSGDFTYIIKGLDVPNYLTESNRFIGEAGQNTARLVNANGTLSFINDSNTTIFSESWNNESTIAVTLSGTTLKVYADATQLGIDTDVTGSTFANINSVGNSTESINGSLQELYVYDRALTQDEINWFSYLRNDQNEILRPPLLPS